MTGGVDQGKGGVGHGKGESGHGAPEGEEIGAPVDGIEGTRTCY